MKEYYGCHCGYRNVKPAQKRPKSGIYRNPGQKVAIKMGQMNDTLKKGICLGAL